MIQSSSQMSRTSAITSDVDTRMSSESCGFETRWRSTTRVRADRFRPGSSTGVAMDVPRDGRTDAADAGSAPVVTVENAVV
jgi:hypothetical protein